MEKVRNFFRKPLDNPSNLWYNLGVRQGKAHPNGEKLRSAKGLLLPPVKK